MNTNIIFKFDELGKVADKLAEQLKNCKIITFKGPLGAGKTTLIRELLNRYGIKEGVVSPTFTYMNVYKSASGKTFFHFDLYRIKSVNDFLMAGFDEYFHVDNSQCFIEWPEVIESLLQDSEQKICNISIDYLSENERILKF